MAGPVAADAQMQCTDFCGKKAGAKPAKLCGMTHVLHDTGENSRAHLHGGFRASLALGGLAVSLANPFAVWQDSRPA